MRRAPGLWATGTALAATIALSLWAAPRVGDRLPVHWNFAGEVDRYGTRFEGLVLLPLLTLGMGVLLAVLPRFEPRRCSPQWAGTCPSPRSWSAPSGRCCS